MKDELAGTTGDSGKGRGWLDSEQSRNSDQNSNSNQNSHELGNNDGSKSEGRTGRVAPALRFRDGLLPAIVQDVRTGQVLMLAYMNEESLRRTLAEGRTWFWSRTRRSLWMKGETSGNVQKVVSVTEDCDGDALLVQVEQQGTGACHEGDFSCFHYPLSEFSTLNRGAGSVALSPSTAAVAPTEPAAATTSAVSTPTPAMTPASSPATSLGPGAADAPFAGAEILAELWQVIEERRRQPREGSYTSKLFAQGMERIAKKVGEEATEVVIEALKKDNRAAFVYENADLIYHLLVMLAAKGVTPAEVFAELSRRR